MIRIDAVLVRVQFRGGEPHTSSSKQTAKQKPSLPPAGAQGGPRASLLAPRAGSQPSLQPRAGKQRDQQPGSRGSGGTRSSGCAEGPVPSAQPRHELSMHQAAPSRRAALAGLLTPSERGSSPLLWPEEYRLTYSPSPASSLAFSLWGRQDERKYVMVPPTSA